MSEEKDPWASLADSLGAAPNRESAPPPPAKAPQSPRPERRPEPKAAAARSTPSWDDLDASLGLPAARETARPTEPKRAEPRPESRAEPRPAEGRREFGFDDQPRRSDRSVRVDRDDRAQREDRTDRDAQGELGGEGRRTGGQPRAEGDEPAGDDRPRRRRGRRGGRRRGGRGRREEGASSRTDESPVRDAEPGAEPIDDFVDERPMTADAESGERPLDDEGRPRRRRRRRGRRGGRRGAGGQGGDTTAPQGATDRPETGGDSDDEPLPAGYGRQQSARQPESRDADARSEGGERRGRRRRGRGRGEDSTRRASGETTGDASRRRGRRSRRGSEERTSSSSSLARRSRDDFAPVSRGFEEDDEGLEFLGVEEASRDQSPRREPRHVDEDDVLVESGLNAVRDVPSWVEAIGIVIAGNLDARSRPRSERSDDDRRRR